MRVCGQWPRCGPLAGPSRHVSIPLSRVRMTGGRVSLTESRRLEEGRMRNVLWAAAATVAVLAAGSTYAQNNGNTTSSGTTTSTGSTSSGTTSTTGTNQSNTGLSNVQQTP